MRILLDESVPSHLGALLTGHTPVSVHRRGWAGIKNGKLLALATGEFDVLLTADKVWSISRIYPRFPSQYW